MKRVVTKHLINHPPRAEDFTTIECEAPACPAGGVLARVVYLSLDPYIGSVLRGRHFAFQVPEPMVDAPPTSVVAQVIESQSDALREGDWVCGDSVWQDLAVFAAGKFKKIDPSLAPLSTFVGVLGTPGLTAWASAKQLARVRDGDVVLVNAAAGPVGGTFGQLSRHCGAKRVVGVAGGAKKCALVVEQYGFDACIDYRSADWQERLRDALPDGLSVFHENVSADMAMLALSHAQPYARGVLCGLAAAYQGETQSAHCLNAGLIIAKRAQVSGVVVYDFLPKYQEFVTEIAALLKSGELTYIEDSVTGLEQAPRLFERLIKGANIGKALVKVADE